jgi:hypothetical protein
LIIHNGDIDEDQLGHKYDGLKDYWANPIPEGRSKFAQAMSEEGFRDEFLNDVRVDLADRISPNLWKPSGLIQHPVRREIAIDLMEGLRENLDWLPRYQAYLRENRPATLIV